MIGEGIEADIWVWKICLWWLNLPRFYMHLRVGSYQEEGRTAPPVDVFTCLLHGYLQPLGGYKLCSWFKQKLKCFLGVWITHHWFWWDWKYLNAFLDCNLRLKSQSHWSDCECTHNYVSITNGNRREHEKTLGEQRGRFDFLISAVFNYFVTVSLLSLSGCSFFIYEILF